jgi:hypothetical protein
LRQSVKRCRPLARQETEAHFAGPSGQGGLLLVACGALAHELVDIQRQFPDGVVEITCLPASWHNHPEKIVPGVRRKVDAALRTRRNVAVVYGDCGTVGELDAYLEQVGVPRIPGPHCYKMFLGKPVFHDEMDNALGTFFLTDYMVRHFERIVMQGMGLRRHPQLRDMYFGNYTRVLYIAQTEDTALRVRAEQAAQELGLAFGYRLAGYGGFPGFVEEALAKTQATADPPAS